MAVKRSLIRTYDIHLITKIWSRIIFSLLTFYSKEHKSFHQRNFKRDVEDAVPYKKCFLLSLVGCVYADQTELHSGILNIS